MEEEVMEPAAPARDTVGKKPRKIGRRTALKAGAAVSVGLALGTTYVTPTAISIGVQETYATSVPPPDPGPSPTPPPDLPQGCTPGYWGNSPHGRHLWDDASPDPEWTTAGGVGANPFIHTTLFNSFFAPVSALDAATMINLVDTGGGSDPIRQAARDLVAAYLNASFGMGYAYSTTQLQTMWSTAVSSNSNNAYRRLHTTLDAANNAACPTPITKWW